MTHFCPQCWKQVAREAEICPHCGSPLAEEDAKPFVEKLRSALRHPEPETAIRAAWILGERREISCAADLIGVVEKTRDLYLVESAAEALGKLGDARALPALERGAASGPLRVRRACKLAVRKIQGRIAADRRTR